MGLSEKVILPEGLLEVHFESRKHYKLKYGDVEYANGVRTVRGKKVPYTFRSVEQMRYDFERDIEAA